MCRCVYILVFVITFGGIKQFSMTLSFSNYLVQFTQFCTYVFIYVYKYINENFNFYFFVRLLLFFLFYVSVICFFANFFFYYFAISTGCPCATNNRFVSKFKIIYFFVCFCFNFYLFNAILFYFLLFYTIALCSVLFVCKAFKFFIQFSAR